MKSNVSHILIPRESVPRQTPRELSKDEKTKKEQHQQLVVFLSRLFRALFFLSFFRDVSTLTFLHFFNRNEEEFSSVSFPRYTDAIHPIHRRRRGAL